MGDVTDEKVTAHLNRSRETFGSNFSRKIGNLDSLFNHCREMPRPLFHDNLVIQPTASLNKARNTVKESVYSINLLLLLLLPPPPPRPLLEAGNFLTSLVTTTFSRRLPLQGVRLLGWRI
jgi:hypothetical protein